MTTDPARRFTDITAHRHVRFGLLLREALCDPNTPTPPASTGPSQPTPPKDPASPNAPTQSPST